MNDDVKFGSGDRENWLKNHTLSKEQVRQLMLNKYERAKKDQEKLEQLKKLVQFTD